MLGQSQSASNQTDVGELQFVDLIHNGKDRCLNESLQSLLLFQNTFQDGLRLISFEYVMYSTKHSETGSLGAVSCVVEIITLEDLGRQDLTCMCEVKP